MNEEAAKPDALLWLDFETTGIDRASSLPLEVGMECTDVLGEQSFGSLTRIIRPASLGPAGYESCGVLDAHRQRTSVRAAEQFVSQ